MNNRANEFKHFIALKGTTLEAVASIIGVNRSTLYRKLRLGTDALTLAETQKISRFLCLSPEEILEVFLHIKPSRPRLSQPCAMFALCGRDASPRDADDYSDGSPRAGYCPENRSAGAWR